MTQITTAESAVVAIPDVQGSADTRRIPINKVGIKDIRHPVRIRDRGGYDQHTVATFNMYVNLPHDFKGTHMSRFVSLLNEQAREITVASFREMLGEMTTRLEAEVGHIEMSFTFFVNKAAPVSRITGLMDYEVTLIGEIRDSQPEMWLQVVVPATSLCPCSKKISDYGAHNQRSHITLKVKASENLWIEELIDLAEREASSELYAILKRPDEKHVTERAYENPKFVEDIVRDLAACLDADQRILAYSVATENFESIHNHSAYALIERDKETGTAHR